MTLKARFNKRAFFLLFKIIEILFEFTKFTCFYDSRKSLSLFTGHTECL